MAISVILIRVNLRVDPRVCYRCHTDCMRFNSSSKILFVIAEGFYLLNHDAILGTLGFIHKFLEL